MPATLEDILGGAVLAELDSSQPLHFTDAAKTTPAGDGDSVHTWATTSLGNTHDLQQVSIMQQPVFRADADGGGFPGMEFDGIAQTIGVVHPDFQETDWYAIVVATYNGTPPSASTMLHRGSAVAFQRLDHSGSAQRLQTIGAGIADVTMPATITGRFCTALSSRSDGSAGSHRIASVGLCAGRADNVEPPIGDGSLWIGSRAGTQQYFKGWIHHVIVIDHNCHWGDIIKAATLLRSQWSIPDPEPVPDAPAAGSGGFSLSRIVNS